MTISSSENSAVLSDLDFVGILRGTVERYFAVVDKWEAIYSRYYRMPGGAKESDDLVDERREFEDCRGELAKFMPRARGLCFRHNQPDVFAALLHVPLGQFAPQERTDSAISRGERGAIMACLIELTVACREAEAESAHPRRKPSLLDRILALF